MSMSWIDHLLSRFRASTPRLGRRARPLCELLECREILDAGANEIFVTQAYHDLLLRDPDPGGLALFANSLNNGTANRVQVALRIQGSPEYRTNQVQSLFTSVLNRPADSVGLGASIAFLASTGTIEQLQSLIAG